MFVCISMKTTKMSDDDDNHGISTVTTKPIIIFSLSKKRIVDANNTVA